MKIFESFKHREFDEFRDLIMRLEITEVLGVARLVGAEFDETTAAEDILIQTFQAFPKMRPKQRRNLLKIMRAAVGEDNGS